MALKGGDKDYWLLNSALAKLVDKNLTQIIDALVGVPIVDYISNVWATSLVITVLSHSGQVRVMSRRRVSCRAVSCHMCAVVRALISQGECCADGEARGGAEEGGGLARGGDQEVLPRQQGQVARQGQGLPPPLNQRPETTSPPPLGCCLFQSLVPHTHTQTITAHHISVRLQSGSHLCSSKKVLMCTCTIYLHEFTVYTLLEGEREGERWVGWRRCARCAKAGVLGALEVMILV